MGINIDRTSKFLHNLILRGWYSKSRRDFSISPFAAFQFSCIAYQIFTDFEKRNSLTQFDILGVFWPSFNVIRKALITF